MLSKDGVLKTPSRRGKDKLHLKLVLCQVFDGNLKSSGNEEANRDILYTCYLRFYIGDPYFTYGRNSS